MFYTWLIITTVLLFFFAISCIYALVVWIRRRRHTKERFAFAALTAITALTMGLFAAVVGQSTPWHLIAAGMRWAFGVEVTLPAPTFADYALLVAVYGFALLTIRWMFQGWDGLRSERQHDIEQRRESMSLFLEGVREFSRIIQRSDPLTIYQSEAHKLTSQLEGATDSIAWRDRARALVRLKWSCYAFSGDTDWHDREGCWVGRNVDTNDLVLLRCAPDTMDASQIKAFVAYAERLRSDRSESRVELIVAIENEHALPTEDWNGAPVQFETEATLLEQLVDWTDYRNDVRRRMSVDQLPDSDLTISDVFVQPRFTPVGWDLKGSGELEGFLEKWLHEPGQRQLALLGNYGEGKSTAALAFVHKLLKCGSRARTPILIELRGTSPRNLTTLQLLGAWSAKYNINPQALLRLHIAGRLLLIFEGFDEMALVGDAEMRLKHFKTLWEFCYPRAKILITGRPNFFFDKQEMIASLGIGEPIAGRPYCQSLRLEAFDLGQVRNALRNHDPVLREEICSFAQENEQFRELISRPSLLHIVSVLWHREDLSTQLDKLTSAYVMKLFIQHSYRRQGLKESASPGFMALTTEERHYFMQGVATYMAAKRLPNQINGAQLNEVVTSLIDAIPDAVSLRSSAITAEVRQPLKERIADSEYGLVHIQTDVRTCGIIVDDPVAPGTFHFGHKSFMEYLFAEVVAERIIDEETPDAPSILNACGARAADIAYLPVSIGFLSELLGTNVQYTEDSLATQKVLAKRILRLLHGGTPQRYIMGRLLLYGDSLRRSIRVLPPVSRALVLGTLYPWPGGLALIIALQVPGVLLMDSIPTKLPIIMALNALMLVSANVVITSTLLWHRSVSTTMRISDELLPGHRMSLWNRLCKELKFDDRVLFQIAGISWLPWTRNQTFDYFLESKGDE